MGGPRSLDAVLAGLASWLDHRSPSSRHVITGHRSPAAGYSSETLLVDVARTEGGQVRDERVVVKLPPTGPAIFDRYDFPMQAAVQEAASAAGIPTATPAVAEVDLRWVGAPFLVMPAVPGHLLSEVPAFDERLTAAGPSRNADLHGTYVELIADINRIDWKAAGLDGVVPRRDDRAELAHWRDYLAWYAEGEERVPALTAALDWCEAHLPDHEPGPSLLWGDVRLENLILDDDHAVRAVLDWEMATIGAAEHDLAWAVALQENQDVLVRRTVPGFLDHDACVRRFEARLGRPVRDLDWYEVFASFRSTAILSRIGHLQEQRGEETFFPVADNPVVDTLLRRIDEASATT